MPRKVKDMSKQKVFLLAQSILCILLVLLLAAAAIRLFREGVSLRTEDPLHWIFTRETVGARLAPILPLLFLSLVLTVLGLALGIKDEKAERPGKDVEYLRDIAVSRVAEPNEAMKTENARQKKLFFGGWALFALCMLPVLLYLVNGDHFPDGSLEPVLLSLAAHTLPWVAAGLAVLAISTVLQGRSMVRETEAAREQTKLEKAGGIRPEGKTDERKAFSHMWLLQGVVLALAVALIVAGVRNGSAADVFGKAVKICTECVGLG